MLFLSKVFSFPSGQARHATKVVALKCPPFSSNCEGETPWGVWGMESLSLVVSLVPIMVVRDQYKAKAHPQIFPSVPGWDSLTGSTWSITDRPSYEAWQLAAMGNSDATGQCQKDTLESTWSRHLRCHWWWGTEWGHGVGKTETTLG